MKSAGKTKTCKCLAEYEADKERFAKEAITAFEEPVEDYQGGFVPRRYVEPPKVLTLECEQRCPEASDLLERLARHAAPRESNYPQTGALLLHRQLVQDA